MRRILLSGALVVSLSGCGVVARPSDLPTQATSPAPSSGTVVPTRVTPIPARAALTIPQARQAMQKWVGRYNATLKKREWWRSNARLDALFIEGALHEGVLERNQWGSERKTKHKPINPISTPTVFLPRPERQPSIGDWFIAQATYQDAKGRARPHVLAFFRSPGQPFRLAVATPIHWGERMPKPLLDADGYVTDMDDSMAGAVAKEYENFWNGERKKEGDSGYRLAENSYSRKAFPAVDKGAYVGFAGTGSVFGFRTADGGSFFLFALLNDDKRAINNVLSEALLVPKGSNTIRELGANWFS
ncbi:hypothetical protein [Nonomuraea diastatica]|uniref:DUF8094 domain-containing protein n=1 Tax=Nonomuraea diastatica TaxID=1848329 RepID=A0A4R4WCL5_9ACTN|nr:hypothetical protein [Nonomuraea diastatica]TDD11160.1 hypothetical protein E1294_45470 [Nonomuraea diastatica]